MRPLAPNDIPSLIALQQACYAADGYYAIPLEWDFENALTDSIATSRETHDGQLMAAAWLRESTEMLHLRMLAHPDHHDLKPHLLEWAETVAREHDSPVLRIHDQAVTESAAALYLSHGYTRIFAEDVLHYNPLTSAPISDDLCAAFNSPRHEGKGLGVRVKLHNWSAKTASQFYTAYRNAFSTRPGFNPLSQDAWIADHQGDPDFRPDLSYVAIQNDALLGFVVSVISTTRNVWGKRGGWVDQVGVIPAARGKGLASHLILRAMQGMSEIDHVLLHVNVNNPSALRLYQHLGFTLVGCRARYEKSIT